MEEKVWSRLGGEQKSLHLSRYKHYLLVFLFSFPSCFNKESENHWQGLQMAEALADCRSISKFTQVGQEARLDKTALWRGKESIFESVFFFVFLLFSPLIFLPAEVRIFPEWQRRWARLQKLHQVACQPRRRPLWKGAQAWPDWSEARLCLPKADVLLPAAAVWKHGGGDTASCLSIKQST